uniref:Uncharacterized protein n=1 Tax=Ditylenchus dipsaci TaxID=166011 RepID=A0A915DKE4_9BILA
MIALKLPREAIMKELDRTKNKELIKRYSQEPEDDKIDRFEIHPDFQTMAADISFKTTNGKTFKADSFEEAFKILADYHQMIPKVTIIGIVFDQELFQLFSSTDRIVWKE